MATFYVSPTGSGLGDGSSIQNAGTLSSLNKYIRAAGPGGEVLLIADKGVYQQNTQISISAGGTDGAPVTIRGIDSQGNPMAAELRGSRSANWTAGMSQGNELFRLLSGANNLVFQDLTTRNFGNGVFRAGANISNLTIRDIDATNVSRFVENYASGTATSASIDGLTVRDVTVTGFSQGAIRLQYDTRNVVIDRVVGDSQRQDGGNYIFGVMLDDTVHDVVISNTTMKNNYGHAAGKYWNGDGFTTERDVYNVQFVNTYASGNTDAGYDLKSDNTTLVNAVAEGNGRNYRFWSQSITLKDSISRNPTFYGGTTSIAHVWLGLNAAATIDGLTFSDSTTPKKLFDLTQGGATLRVTNTEIPDVYKSLIRVSNGSSLEYFESNSAPTGVTVSGGTIEENALAGTCAAVLSALDPDAGDTHSFALAGGATNLFEMIGNEIRVRSGAVLDFETQASHSLLVKVTDQDGLSASQTVAINLTNVVEGGGTAGHDTLTGGPGGDYLAGGAGNDTYIVNSPDDIVVEKYKQGSDWVKTTLGGYTLGANVEHLAFIGTGAFAGTGNSLNNTIIGGDGNDMLRGAGGKDRIRGELGDDRLEGGSGNDTLIGGAGDDTYVVNNAGDSVVEKAGEGTDTIEASVSRTLGSYFENLTLTGANAIKGTGNGQSNVLLGNNAANILNGAAGDDVLNGAAGNDTLIGGAGADTYLFDRGGGADAISNADTDLGADKLVFGAGIARDQLWFAQSGSDLLVSVLGGSDRATLQGWYASTANQLDHFGLSDGSTLAAANVQQLVNAMSAFSVPPSSISDLTMEQQQSVESVIAANWRSAT